MSDLVEMRRVEVAKSACSEEVTVRRDWLPALILERMKPLHQAPTVLECDPADARKC